MPTAKRAAERPGRHGQPGGKSGPMDGRTARSQAARIHYPVSEELRRNKVRTLANAKAEVAKVFALELSQLAEPQRQQLLDGPARDQHLVILGSAAHRARPRPAPAEELLRVTFTALLTAGGLP
jgi:hypothetical protein